MSGDGDSEEFMRFGLLAVILMAGCDCTQPPVYKRYRLSDGRIVKCASVAGKHCGTDLYDCEDGVERWCQVNLERLP